MTFATAFSVVVLVAQHLVRQWIHVLRQLEDDDWKNYWVFYVVGQTRILRSFLFSLRPRSSSITAVACLFYICQCSLLTFSPDDDDEGFGDDCWTRAANKVPKMEELWRYSADHGEIV